MIEYRHFATSLVVAALAAACSSSSDSAPVTTDSGNKLPIPSNTGVSAECQGPTRTNPTPASITYSSKPATIQFTTSNTEDEIRRAFVTAKEGDVIEFGEGTFQFSRGLSISASKVSIRGKGMDKTILDFAQQAASGQAGGADGVYGDHVKDFLIESLTLRNAPQNDLKVEGAENVVIRSVRTDWTNHPNNPELNGGYGIYPVQTKNILIEGCDARGATDTGIYVGQSQYVIVRGNNASGNVGGVEIENTFFADVYQNTFVGNTGGVLVFDNPDLQQEGGHHARVFQNTIIGNNTKNFAAEGNILGQVPAGTGVIIMATHDVEVFDNEIADNQTVAITIISRFTPEPTFDLSKHPGYYPYSYNVSIHDNTFRNNGTAPDRYTLLGLVLSTSKQGFDNGIVSNILFDGIVDQAHGSGTNPMQVCIQSNGCPSYRNLHFEKFESLGSLDGSPNFTNDPENVYCSLQPLAPITLGPLP